MYRNHAKQPGVAITNDIDTCTAVSFSNWAGGLILFPDDCDQTEIAIYVAEDADGTFTLLYDTGGNAIDEIPVAASRAVPIPDEAFGAGSVKFLGDNANSVDVIVSLKG